MTCTFFGHSYISEDIKPRLTAAVIDLIENHGVNKFYVGTHGEFDRTAFEVLCELAEKYDIDFKQVLSKVPGKLDESDRKDYSLTVVPDGIENAHFKYRINYRNKWMIKQSQYVITYITNPYGTGAALYAELAEKQKKVMIKLGKY